MTTIELSDNAQKMLDDLICAQDLDPRIPHAFTPPPQMVELALILLDTMNKCQLEAQGQQILELTILLFQKSMLERGK